MNRILEKIPKPLLVGIILAIAIALFVINDPLRDECAVQTKIFERNTRGILSAIRTNKKIQFAKIKPMRDLCREGNSVGACSEYFQALRSVSTELKVFNSKCQIKYAVDHGDVVSEIGSALKTMALVAWGDKPPASLSERAGWLTEPDLKTFCTLKKAYLNLSTEEEFGQLRNGIFRDFPDSWPEMKSTSETSDVANRYPEDRPRALKSAGNPQGQFDEKKIFERSLFSIRCDLYL